MLRSYSPNMTVAARQIAEKETLGHLSQRVVTRRQSLSLPGMISMRLRYLYFLLSYLTGFPQDSHPGMQGFIPFSSRVPLNQSAP